MRIFWVLALCCLFPSLSVAQLDMSLQHSLNLYPARTSLSKTALRLRVGMSKVQVYKLLGAPTWASAGGGEFLAWSWRNGRCTPVVVTFDKSMHVTGFDEGRSECLDTTYDDLPSDRYLCDQQGQHRLCQDN